MPTYTITNYDSATVSLTIDGQQLLFKKVYVTTAVSGDYFYFYAHQVEVDTYRQQYKIHYTDCTNPSAASAAALKTAVDVIVNSYIGGGADPKLLLSYIATF